MTCLTEVGVIRIVAVQDARLLRLILSQCEACWGCVQRLFVAWCGLVALAWVSRGGGGLLCEEGEEDEGSQHWCDGGRHGGDAQQEREGGRRQWGLRWKALQ
jgi:hypothetical protein